MNKVNTDRGLSLLEVSVVMLVLAFLALGVGQFSAQSKSIYSSLTIARDISEVKQDLIKKENTAYESDSLAVIKLEGYQKEGWVIIKKGKYNNEIFNLTCSFLADECVRAKDGKLELVNREIITSIPLGNLDGIGVIYHGW